jgi:hypothetical protein
VYYQVFKPEGLAPCKKPVDPEDPYLARIDVENISPPRTVAAVTQHISVVEGISDTQRVLGLKLFESGSRSVPLDNQKPLTILDGSVPGVDPQEPLAFVVCNLFEKPILARCKFGEQQTIVLLILEPAHLHCEDNRQDRAWLSYTTGDILYTNSVLFRNIKRNLNEYFGAFEFTAYRARNANGQIGCMCKLISVQVGLRWEKIQLLLREQPPNMLVSRWITHVPLQWRFLVVVIFEAAHW